MARQLLSTVPHLLLLLLLVILGTLVRYAPRTPFDPVISGALIVALALPSFYHLSRSEGVQRGIALAIGLSLLSMSVEAIGVVTGVPYGWFHYAEAIGSAAIGPVPWTVGFAYVPLLLGTTALAGRLLPYHSLATRVAASALLLVAVDLVLDPGAALLGYWVWSEQGAYYGIPLSNYLGWFLTGTLYSALVFITVRHPLPLETAWSLLLITCFWTGVALGAGMLVPILIGAGIAAFSGAVLLRKGLWFRQSPG